MIRTIAPLLLLGLVTSSFAQEPVPAYERVIANEFELSTWCEQEARHHYIAKNITPYQWTSRYFDRSNVLHVEGSLRAQGADVPVRCRIARGAREQYAIIEIQDPVQDPAVD